MSSEALIVCKPTQWIKIRGVLIILMFAVFAWLFYKDGTTGYREKNQKKLMHVVFTQYAGDELENYKGDAEGWAAYLSSKPIPIPAEDEVPLPQGFDRQQPWPEAILENYAVLRETSSGSRDLWKEYSGAKGWPLEPEEKFYDQGKLNEQIYLAYGCSAVAFIALIFFLRVLSRDMRVTQDAYIAPGGTVVPFASMLTIDKRKWDTKGVARITYDREGEKKHTKVDGMIYGQFKKEDGEPAEKLFAHILEHFKGEVIEYEEEQEEELVESAEKPEVT